MLRFLIRPWAAKKVRKRKMEKKETRVKRRVCDTLSLIVCDVSGAARSAVYKTYILPVDVQVCTQSGHVLVLSQQKL